MLHLVTARCLTASCLHLGAGKRVWYCSKGSQLDVTDMSHGSRNSETSMRYRLPAADADLQEQLLSGGAARDVEQGEQRQRGWYQLIGTALKHVWPTQASMQLRVVACLLVIVVQRVVNLAVPILCASLFRACPNGAKVVGQEFQGELSPFSVANLTGQGCWT